MCLFLFKGNGTDQSIHSRRLFPGWQKYGVVAGKEMDPNDG